MDPRRVVKLGVALSAWPVLAWGAPNLVVTETAWEPVDGKLVSAVSRLSVNDVVALRALEIRVYEPLAPGEKISLECAPAAPGMTILPPKEFETPRTLVFAVVFPTTPAVGTVEALGELGVLRRVMGREAGNPMVTARGILNDGSRVDVSVSYLRSAAHETAVSSGPTGLLLAPNPTSGGVEVRYRVEVTTRVEVSVFDVNGRRIRGLFSGVQEPGDRSLRWDGRDDLQRPVPLGVYVMNLKLGNVAKTQRVVLVR